MRLLIRAASAGGPVILAALLGAATLPGAAAVDAAGRGEYVGSATCATCHEGIYKSQQKTAHVMKTLPAIQRNLVMPAKNNVILTDDGKARFKLRKRGGKDIFLTLYNLDGSGGTEFRVSRTLGGFGVAGKQRLMLAVDENGQSTTLKNDKSTLLISPVQFNHHDTTKTGTSRFNAYHPEHWYNSDGTLIGGATGVAASQFKNAWERRCNGCHATGNDVQYDASTGMYLDQSSEYNVQCEACHGPGGDHAASRDAEDIVNPAKMGNAQRALDTCARCHIRGGNVGEGNFSTGYPAKVKNNRITFPPFGALLADWYTPGEGWWNSNDEAKWGNRATEHNTSKKHHQQGADYVQSAHWAGSTKAADGAPQIQCWECHDPHTNGVAAGQLRVRADDNSLCLTCHSGQYPTAASITAHTKHSYNPGTSGASRCISCHMNKAAKSQQWYFEHSGDITNHTFEVVKPTLTGAMARKGGTVAGGSAISNGCDSCHQDDDYGVARWKRWRAM